MLDVESLYFFYISASTKFQNPKRDEGREEEKNTINSGFSVLPATPQGRAVTSLRQTIDLPIEKHFYVGVGGSNIQEESPCYSPPIISLSCN